MFLTDRHAYKLKKPARLPHLDFSTLKARETNSLTEVRLNWRLAPNVYLGVVGLMSSLPDGTLYLGSPRDGAGKVVDWLVWMERLPVNHRLDEVIRRDTVTRDDIAGLSTVLLPLLPAGSDSPDSPIRLQQPLRAGCAH